LGFLINLVKQNSNQAAKFSDLVAIFVKSHRYLIEVNYNKVIEY